MPWMLLFSYTWGGRELDQPAMVQQWRSPCSEASVQGCRGSVERKPRTPLPRKMCVSLPRRGHTVCAVVQSLSRPTLCDPCAQHTRHRWILHHLSHRSSQGDTCTANFRILLEAEEPPHLCKMVHGTQDKNLCLRSLPVPAANTRWARRRAEGCIPVSSLAHV